MPITIDLLIQGLPGKAEITLKHTNGKRYRGATSAAGSGRMNVEPAGRYAVTVKRSGARQESSEGTVMIPPQGARLVFGTGTGRAT